MEAFIEFTVFGHRDVREGFIVIAACMDDFAAEFSDYGKKWFEELGSKEIWKIKYR